MPPSRVWSASTIVVEIKWSDWYIENPQPSDRRKLDIHFIIFISWKNLFKAIQYKDESPFTRSLAQGRPKPPLASPLHSACFPLPCSQESTMESRAGGQHACIHIPTTFPWGGRASNLLPSGSASRLRDAVATGKVQGILEQK